MQTAFLSEFEIESQKLHKTSMKGARTAIEWSYGKVKEIFTTLDFNRKVQVRKVPVALLYIINVMLLDFKTCIGHGTFAEI